MFSQIKTDSQSCDNAKTDKDNGMIKYAHGNTFLFVGIIDKAGGGMRKGTEGRKDSRKGYCTTTRQYRLFRLYLRIFQPSRTMRTARSPYRLPRIAASLHRCRKGWACIERYLGLDRYERRIPPGRTHIDNISIVLPPLV
jgi:hypothetical protein